MSELYVRTLRLGPMENFVYLAGCRSANQCAVIDPGWEADVVIEAAAGDGMEITHVLLTHTHHDHIGALDEIVERCDPLVCLHPAERETVSTPDAQIRLVDDGDEVAVGQVKFRVIHTPGHSAGGVCYYAPGCLFSGDTLFVFAYGRTDLPGGDPRQMWRSLTQKLFTLPPDTVVYSGHDYGDQPTSTIGEERDRNPAAQYDNAEDFARESW